MVYSLVRLCIGIILFICLLYVFKRKRILNKKSLCSIILITILFTFCLFKLPVEKYLINFSCAEDAFRYFKSNDIITVIQGNNSCVVVYTESTLLGEDDSYNLLFLNKTEEGYKVLPKRPVAGEEGYFATPEISGFVYHIANTQDTYILFHISNKMKDIDITDNRNSKMKSFITNTYGKVYYNWVDNIGKDEYYIMLDDEKIPMKKSLGEKYKETSIK